MWVRKKVLDDLYNEVCFLRHEMQTMQYSLQKVKDECFEWTRALMDRFVELSMVQSGKPYEATLHRRVIGSYPGDLSPGNPMIPLEGGGPNEDEDWNPNGSDVVKG